MVSLGTEVFVAGAALILAMRKTPYQPSIGSIWIIIAAAILMTALLTYLPFNVYISTIIAIITYIIFIISTRIVTVRELRSLVKD